MKHLTSFSRIQILLFSLFTSVLTFAQEKGADLDVDIDVDKGGAMGGDWLSNPLVWVIGALVLILIIALIARGGSSNRA